MGFVTTTIDIDVIDLLPVPKVAVKKAITSGFDRLGNPLTCDREIVITLVDIPEDFLSNSGYKFRLELGRNKLSQNHGGSGYPSRIRKGGGIVFPSPSLANGNPDGEPVRGTRYGAHSGLVTARPTIWSLNNGYKLGDKITLSGSEIFGPWFDRFTYTDRFTSNSSNTLRYKYRGGMGNYRGAQGPTWFSNGYFCFRYAITSATGEPISGPRTPMIKVYPSVAPTIPLPYNSFPVDQFGFFKIINPAANGQYNLTARWKVGSQEMV